MSFNKTVTCWISLAIVFAASSGRPQSTEAQYVVAQTVDFHQKDKDVSGTLQVLIDIRLSESVQKELWGNGDWSFVFPSDSNLYKDLANHPPIKSRLRLMDSEGKLVAKRDLERPLAKLQVLNPTVEAGQFFLLTQDYSVGFGSYNGLITTVLRVTDATLQEINALNIVSRQKEPIRMMKSLKSDWRAIQLEGVPEILSVSCHRTGMGNSSSITFGTALREAAGSNAHRKWPVFGRRTNHFPSRLHSGDSWQAHTKDPTVKCASTRCRGAV